MDVVKTYYDRIKGMLDEILSLERQNIEKAAQLVAQTVIDDKLFYVFGTGAHSIMPAMELFLRAGGLCNVQGIFPPGVTDFNGTPKTERVMGFAPRIFDYYGLKAGDVLMICNVNGINPMTIDAAEEARKRKLKTIGVTSIQFSKQAEPNIPNRHPSNKNLFELVDVVIDVHVPVGDALLDVPGVPVKVGAGSTYPMIFAVNSVIVRAIEITAAKGHKPPVMLSGNIAAGDDYNRKYEEKYRSRIRHFE
ncbi:MAG: SIS domain-containing protein [Spirochaetes bacterium]|nr:SIS domain-containing protein [Spirochaetota bacterium]MCX7040190.1 SIS domain-containing protein [Spirochaetota bacterium]